MKGDFTRSTFRPQKHYTSVRMQQGRLQLDADWNEQMDIQQHLFQTQARDMLGLAGVPVADASTERSFQLNAIDDGKDLTITPGRIYVNGTLCELETGSFLTFEQKSTELDRLEINVPTLQVDGQNLQSGQWIELFQSDPDQVDPTLRVKIATVDPTPRSGFFTLTLDSEVAIPTKGRLRRILTLTTQPDYPKPAEQIDPKQSWVTLSPDKSYLAYLDVWQRHITAIEDPTIRESAINLPDTTTRTQTIWQIKLLELNPNIAIDDQWNAFLKSRKAQLRARANPATNTNSSLRRLENQLYRIEIHTPGKIGTATFKWSRDNGAIVSAIETLDDTISNVITIAQPHRDPSQLFAPNQWVEISDEVRELNRLPGTLVRLTSATAGTKLVFQKAKDRDAVNLEQFPLSQKPKVRRWDHTTSSAEIQTAAEPQWIPLGNEGIEVWFEPGSVYQTGDYWLIPARTTTNDIEWLRDDARNPLPQEIAGIEHAYARLAILTYTDKVLNVQDVRNSLPALSDCLPKIGGTITGSLAIADSLTVGRQLTTQQFSTQQFNAQNLTVGRLTVENLLTTQQLNTQQLTVETLLTAQQLNAQQLTTQQLTSQQLTVNTLLNTQQLTAQQLTVEDLLTAQQLRTQQLTAQQLTVETELTAQQLNAQRLNAQQLTSAQLTVNTLLNTQQLTAQQLTVEDLLTAQQLRTQQLTAHQLTVETELTAQQLTVSTQLTTQQLTAQQLTVETQLKTQQLTSDALTLSTGKLNSSTDLFLQTNNRNQISIVNATGNVGIGISAPTVKLHVVAPAEQAQILCLSAGDRSVNIGAQNDNFVHFTTNTKGYQFDEEIRLSTGSIGSIAAQNLFFRTASVNRMTIRHDTGNVGIGTNKPEARLHVAGNIKVDGRILSNDPQIACSSSHKENIIDFTSDEALTLLKELRPVKFAYKADEARQTRAGFIAEEVPPLVASDDRQGVRLMELSAILTQSIKNHEQTIATQAQLLAEQANQISLLSERLFMLESQQRTERKPRSLFANITQMFRPRSRRQ